MYISRLFCLFLVLFSSLSVSVTTPTDALETNTGGSDVYVCSQSWLMFEDEQEFKQIHGTVRISETIASLDLEPVLRVVDGSVTTSYVADVYSQNCMDDKGGEKWSTSQADTNETIAFSWSPASLSNDVSTAQALVMSEGELMHRSVILRSTSTDAKIACCNLCAEDSLACQELSYMENSQILRAIVYVILGVIVFFIAFRSLCRGRGPSRQSVSACCDCFFSRSNAWSRLPGATAGAGAPTELSLDEFDIDLDVNEGMDSHIFELPIDDLEDDSSSQHSYGSDYSQEVMKDVFRDGLGGDHNNDSDGI